jgi:hypothetical protein
MQAPKEIPPDYHCKDKFLVQSIVAEEGTTLKDIVPGMVNSCRTRVYEAGWHNTMLKFTLWLVVQ